MDETPYQAETPKTATPRTDAEYDKHCWPTNEEQAVEGLASLRDFARTLERELAQAKADNARLTGICQRLEKCVAEGLTKHETERLRADNARLREALRRIRDEDHEYRDSPFRIADAALAQGGAK